MPSRNYKTRHRRRSISEISATEGNPTAQFLTTSILTKLRKANHNNIYIFPLTNPIVRVYSH